MVMVVPLDGNHLGVPQRISEFIYIYTPTMPATGLHGKALDLCLSYCFKVLCACPG
jgi:hypothetical protein